MKEFLKKFIRSEKLRVEEQGTHLGFITFSSDNQTSKFLKVGEIKNKTELIQWLNSFDNGNDLSGDRTLTNEIFELANNVS